MKNIHIYIIISVLFLLNTFLIKKILITDELIYNFYSEQLVHDQIVTLMTSQSRWDWVGYVATPLLVLLRVSLVTLCLSTGLFFYDTENKIKFKDLFKISLIGEFVLMIVGYVKLGYFYFINTSYTLQDVQQFYPFSYVNVLNLDKVEPWLVYPLQTINLFEVGYFFVLVYGLYRLLRSNYWKSFEIVAVSYGSGLVIWLGLIMFLTLNLS